MSDVVEVAAGCDEWRMSQAYDLRGRIEVRAYQ
jgi:hypothetical protein